MMRFVVFGIAIYLVSFCPQHVKAQHNTTGRPSILWLSVEDMSPWLNCYGDSTVPTPNIDRLAREGVRYDTAFSTAGVCAPSRCAIITGMYQTSVRSEERRVGKGCT